MTREAEERDPGNEVVTTATADKTSLKNKHLRDADYFVIIAFRSHSMLLTNYATD